MAFSADQNNLSIEEAAYRRGTDDREHRQRCSLGAERERSGSWTSTASGSPTGRAAAATWLGSIALAELAVNPLIDANALRLAAEGCPCSPAIGSILCRASLPGLGSRSPPTVALCAPFPPWREPSISADGAIVNVTPFAADDAPAVVPGLAVRLAELGTAAMLTDPPTRRGDAWRTDVFHSRTAP